jgi:hypothetical protein
MAEAKSKFAGLFQQPPSAPDPEAATAPLTRPLAASNVIRPVGRPPGKRSDPAWKQYSVLLRRETQREALFILRSEDTGQDLSGLVQMLLDEWVKKKRR